MCNKWYEKRHNRLKGFTRDEESGEWGTCISYFCRENPDWETFPEDWVKTYKEGRPRKPITGVTFKPPENDFTILYDVSKATSQLQDKIFTKKLTKGRRVTMREGFLEMKSYEQYDYIVLMEYLRQCIREDSKKCLLSKREWFILQPPLTKKQERDKRLQKRVINY